MTLKKDHKHTGAKVAAGALVAGAVVGAAAVAFSDKKTRDQMLKSANALKDEALKKVKELDKDKKVLEKKAEDAVKEGKKAVEKKALDKAVTEGKKVVEKKIEERNK